MAVITVSGQEFRGELIAVPDSAIVVRTDDRLLVVPFGVIRRVTAGRGVPQLADGLAPSGEVLQHLRTVSRYPRQLSPDATQRLHSVTGEPEVLR